MANKLPEGTRQLLVDMLGLVLAVLVFLANLRAGATIPLPAGGR